MDYKIEVLNIRMEYSRKYEELKRQYREELKTLDDYKPDVKMKKKEEINKKFESKVRSLLKERDEKIRGVLQNALDKLKSKKRGTIKDVSTSEAIYIDHILKSGEFADVKKIAEKYKDNEDVASMVRATISKWEVFKRGPILDILDKDRTEIEDLERKLESGGFSSIAIDEVKFFS